MPALQGTWVSPVEFCVLVEPGKLASLQIVQAIRNILRTHCNSEEETQWAAV